jgi:murein hydrolase activator
MRSVIFFFVLFFSTIITVSAQQTREQLEKQRQQLKNEIDEAQKLLSSNKAETNKSLGGLIILTRKSDLQERVVKTIDKDLNILDDNIYGIQKDVNKYDRLLDTLKLEYAKSMVYAYKNRGNYEFLNFIFSADNFNDAIKRIAYLKSYRAFREMQGQNIIRTQDLRKKRLDDLGATKEIKKSSLEMQKEEMDKLAQQKAEQDKIVADLKKQGKSLTTRIADKERQVAKINAAVKAAIAKAMREDRERARLAALVEAKKRADEAREKDRMERARKADEDKALKIKRDAAIAAGKTPEPAKVTVPAKERKVKEEKIPELVSLSNESKILNGRFESNKGNLPWPVDNPAIINRFGTITLPSGTKMANNAIIIAANIGENVKACFEGEVIMIYEVEDGKFAIALKHGSFITTYSLIKNVAVRKGQIVNTGQALGKVAPNLEGSGSIDLLLSKGDTNYDPEKWLRRK